VPPTIPAPTQLGKERGLGWGMGVLCLEVLSLQFPTKINRIFDF